MIYDRTRGAYGMQDFCKRQNGRNGICRNAANATEIRLAFAEMLQTPRKYGWHLQGCCKCHGNMVGICRDAANATEIRLAFAGMLQTPRKYGWHLQGCCKRHGNTVDICRNAAKATEIRLVFAGSCKHQKREIGTCGTSANAKMGKIVCDPFCMTVKRNEE